MYCTCTCTRSIVLYSVYIVHTVLVHVVFSTCTCAIKASFLLLFSYVKMAPLLVCQACVSLIKNGFLQQVLGPALLQVRMCVCLSVWNAALIWFLYYLHDLFISFLEFSWGNYSCYWLFDIISFTCYQCSTDENIPSVHNFRRVWWTARSEFSHTKHF